MHRFTANMRPIYGTAPSFVHPTMAAPQRLPERPPATNSYHFHATTPISIPLPHAPSQVQFTAEHLRNAFTDNSVYPDPFRRYCLDLVIDSLHLYENRIEPDQNSPEAIQILGPAAACLPSTTAPGSILNVFVDSVEKRCLVCGATKTSMPRILGCVRSHLGLRPFTCPGLQKGCRKCVQGRK
jgi:hypothetical protein